jgi:hypothetical protein
VSSDGSKTYSPTFVWKDVGNKSSVQADFHPIVLGYVNYNFKGVSASTPFST